jgi:flavin-binding protein dodecin
MEFLFHITANVITKMASVAKISEIVGSSNKGWEDAAQVAVNEAVKTIRGIHGIEVVDQTAKVILIQVKLLIWNMH